MSVQVSGIFKFKNREFFSSVDINSGPQEVSQKLMTPLDDILSGNEIASQVNMQLKAGTGSILHF